MKRKHPRLLELCTLFVSAVLLLVFTYVIGRALMPEQNDFGSTWNAYQKEPDNSIDVMFFGSSRVYCDVIPAEIYRQSGSTSYVMAGPEQTASLTYYYIRQCLKTQHPKCIYMEASSAFYTQYQNFSKVNVCNMPLSWNQIQAARQCESGILFQALFPISQFHYRLFQEQTEAQRTAPSLADGIMLAGYTYLADADPDLTPSQLIPLITVDSAQYRDNLSWFRKIAELCKEEDIDLYFYLSPSIQSLAGKTRAALRKDLEALAPNNVLDYTDLSPAIGINDKTDWYDGIHYNYSGAKKFSAYLGKQIQQQLAPTRADTSLWEERMDYMDQLANPSDAS